MHTYVANYLAIYIHEYKNSKLYQINIDHHCDTTKLKFKILKCKIHDRRETLGRPAPSSIQVFWLH